MRVAVLVVVGLLLTLWEVGLGLKSAYPSRLDAENQISVENATAQIPQDKAITERNIHLNLLKSGNGNTFRLAASTLFISWPLVM
jgi:hypothetical protein